MSLDAMYTPHGFVACYWKPSAIAIEAIAGRPVAMDESIQGHLAYVITHEGLVYSLSKLDNPEKKKSPIVTLPMPVGDGSRYIESFPYRFSDCVDIAIELNGGDITAAINDLSAIWGFHNRNYVTLTIDEIAAELTKRGFTKPICIANPYSTTAP
jgi:hypothetical protein